MSGKQYFAGINKKP